MFRCMGVGSACRCRLCDNGVVADAGARFLARYATDRRGGPRNLVGPMRGAEAKSPPSR